MLGTKILKHSLSLLYTYKHGIMSHPKEKHEAARKAISTDRTRTNLLRVPEQNAIAYLVQHIPNWMTSNLLSAIGFFGSILVLIAFILGRHVHLYYLLLGVLGYAVSWFGDSLDGRIAYYRNKPRKWYGFALDITIDWLGIVLMGLGYIIYAEGSWKIFGFAFVVLYGWEMLTALIRYKITNRYAIDSGLFSPTETRLVISLFFVLEVLMPGIFHYFAAGITLVLLALNILDLRNLLNAGNQKDKEEHIQKN